MLLSAVAITYRLLSFDALSLHYDVTFGGPPEFTVLNLELKKNISSASLDNT